MVTTTDSTKIVTTPNVQEHAQSSFKRWLKHSFYFQHTRRYFKSADLQRIAAAVQQAERGHVGEIQVVIEGHLPCLQAYKQNTRKRAEQLFAELGVWDTEHNSGVLLYVNLCERQVELIFDRGLQQAIQQEVWNLICQDMVQQFGQKNYCEAVIQAIKKIGHILHQYDEINGIADVNERPDAPIIIN